MFAARRILAAMIMAIFLITPLSAFAHCDTLDGPVVAAARVALKKGDVTPVLKWVKQADEAQIRAAFARALAVRKINAEAMHLADTYFFETLVRIHRQGEGAAYTGLKEGGSAELGNTAADAVIAAGSADPLIAEATSEVAAGIRRRLQRVMQARRHADESVQAGREYVAAYVDFIHYVEGLHRTIAGVAEHIDGTAAPVHHEH